MDQTSLCFQDYDYTYISDGITSKYNRILIEEDMFFILEGSKGENNVLEVLYYALPTFIRERLMSRKENEVADALKQACLDLNEILERDSKGYATLSGIIRVDDDTYTLHVGDCNLILFSGIIPIYISSKHTMKDKQERKRIEEYSFIHRNKAEGIYNRTRFFGKSSALYAPLVDVTKISERVTHIFLYSSKLVISLSDLITTAMNKRNDKTSTIILNENMTKGNLCLAILRKS